MPGYFSPTMIAATFSNARKLAAVFSPRLPAPVPLGLRSEPLAPVPLTVEGPVEGAPLLPVLLRGECRPGTARLEPPDQRLLVAPGSKITSGALPTKSSSAVAIAGSLVPVRFHSTGCPRRWKLP
jgi:hypothetical protein